MTKESALENFKSVKQSHVVWVDRAKLLIDEVSVVERVKPIEETDDKFAHWFYGDGEILKGLSNNPLECMQNIEGLHKEFHNVYLNIFIVYFSKEQEKKGFFSKLFSPKQNEVKKNDLISAKKDYEKLEDICKKLESELDRLQRRLEAVSDEKIRALT